ncbi:MAG: response regulator transcription factor [Prevotella sp.]|nr:response regulator transcription factor [Prevotella sp.]
MISVMIADDHQVVAEGLARLIDNSKEAKTVTITGRVDETTEQLSRLKPQILLLDVALPDSDGIDAIPALLNASPTTRIIVLTMYAESAVVQRALAAHANGYLFKSVSPEELITAIRTVAKGDTYICEEARWILSAQTEIPPTLTAREREILRLIVQGKTMKEIANELCLGFETVHSYTKYLRVKLNCSNTASLVRTALEQHLV